MNIPGLTKAYLATAIIAAYRIVKYDAVDGAVIQSTSATDLHAGVTTKVPAAVGEHADVIKGGLADIEYGGAVTRGNPLTSDAVGRAVVAAPAAGVNNRIIGSAEVSGVLGDIGQVWIAPGYIQG